MAKDKVAPFFLTRCRFASMHRVAVHHAKQHVSNSNTVIMNVTQK